jgi:tRNA 2-thiouridine synthesizing protein E
MAKKRSAPKARKSKSRAASAAGRSTRKTGGVKSAKRKTRLRSKAAPPSRHAPGKKRIPAKAAGVLPIAGGGGPLLIRQGPAPRTMRGIVHPGADFGSDPEFRDAPEGWTRAAALAQASTAGLTLTDDHWEVIRVLQGCYRDELSPRLRLLRDALEARFASKGGMKHLYRILPGGPIAQGCALAGLKPPHGAHNGSFGSVA